MFGLTTEAAHKRSLKTLGDIAEIFARRSTAEAKAVYQSQLDDLRNQLDQEREESRAYREWAQAKMEELVDRLTAITNPGAYAAFAHNRAQVEARANRNPRPAAQVVDERELDDIDQGRPAEDRPVARIISGQEGLIPGRRRVVPMTYDRERRIRNPKIAGPKEQEQTQEQTDEQAAADASAPASVEDALDAGLKQSGI